MSAADLCVEKHTMDARLWAVFSGCEGEDPKLVALFVGEQDARDYITAKLPDGDDAVFDGIHTPALVTGLIVSQDVSLDVGNDYRIHTHDELIAAIKAGSVDLRDAEGDRT